MQMQMQKTQADVMLAQANAQKAAKEAQGMSRNEIDAARLQVDAQRYASDASIKEQQVENSFIETISKVRNTQVDNELERERLSAENARTQVDMLATVAKLNTLKDRE